MTHSPLQREEEEIRELLVAYALDIATVEERSEAEALLTVPRWAKEMVQIEEDFHMLALEPALLEPPPQLRERILQTTQVESRFADFTQTLCRLIDKTTAQVHELLARIDAPLEWEPGPSANSKILHFLGGPRVADSLVGFVWVEAGTEFPHHTHLGKEQVYVIQGSIEDDNGTIYKRGDLAEAQDGTSHSFRALEGPDLVYLVVLEKGVDFGFPFEV